MIEASTSTRHTPKDAGDADVDKGRVRGRAAALGGGREEDVAVDGARERHGAALPARGPAREPEHEDVVAVDAVAERRDLARARLERVPLPESLKPNISLRLR